MNIMPSLLSSKCAVCMQTKCKISAMPHKFFSPRSHLEDLASRQFVPDGLFGNCLGFYLVAIYQVFGMISSGAVVSSGWLDVWWISAVAMRCQQFVFRPSSLAGCKSKNLNFCIFSSWQPQYRRQAFFFHIVNKINKLRDIFYNICHQILRPGIK